MSPSAAPWFFLSVMTLAVACLGMVVALRHKRAVLRHEERLAAIEKGGQLPALDEDRPKAPWTPRLYLLRGMLWLFVGIAIVIVLVSISLSTARPASLYLRLSDAQALREHGATEEQVKQYLSEEGKRNVGLPMGVASVGLIPIGVSLAYLLFYRKETHSTVGEFARSAERIDSR